MELTFTTDLGQSFVIEIDPGMELENVMALLEAEVRLGCQLFRLALKFRAVGDSCRRTKYIVQWTGLERPEIHHARAWRQRE
jgi:hypothetical protein